MCGICGFVGRDDEALLRQMTRALAHRGPDGEGMRTFPGGEHAPASLGHRRLTIIDLTERGAQPMAYADGRYHITYNGELYNFRELRVELERDGFSFASDCDTEVMLALYARDGRRMLERTNGMFAFAIWDRERGELFLARDRLGIKPLYYTLQDGVLYFASEVRALLPALRERRLRTDALADFLTFLWVPHPDTLLEGVHKLPPGHHAVFRDGRLAIEEYWDVEFAPERRAPGEWSGRLRETVERAVQRQLVSDVPVGAFLSGGIDSSAIVAGATGTLGRVTTYTVGYTPEDLAHDVVPDDLVHARRVGREFGTDYNERVLDPEVVELLPRLVSHLGDPVADPAAISAYLICSAAREKLTVILSGMGGDEIFAGYPRHLALRLSLLADVLPPAARRLLERQIEARVPIGKPGRLRAPRRNLRKLARGLGADAGERYLTYLSYYREPELARLLAPELRPVLETHDPFARHRLLLDRVAGEHWLNQLLYLDHKLFLPCLNLAYTDAMSMAASTEVRVPLLDDEVVAEAARIPPELKLNRLRRKYVFKKSMEGVLPHDVIWRRKAGFGAPIRAWLVGELKPLVDDLLSPASVAARGLFDPREVRRLVDDFAAGREDNALRIWTLLVLELWQREFLDGASTAD